MPYNPSSFNAVIDISFAREFPSRLKSGFLTLMGRMIVFPGSISY
jgi:hypothetical protein